MSEEMSFSSSGQMGISEILSDVPGGVSLTSQNWTEFNGRGLQGSDGTRLTPALHYKPEVGAEGTLFYGFVDNESFTQRYDIATDSWIGATNDLVAHSGESSFPVPGTPYVFGGLGIDGGTVENTLDWRRYNVETDTWTQMSNFPGREREHGIGVHDTTHGYLTLGEEVRFTSNIRNVMRYNHGDDTWTEVDSSIPVNNDHKWGRGFNIGDTIYIGKRPDVFWKYEPPNIWTELPAPPFDDRRIEPVATVVDGQIYFGMGQSQDTGNWKRDLYQFDPGSETWLGQVDDFPGGQDQNALQDGALCSSHSDGDGIGWVGVQDDSRVVDELWKHHA